jgi:hypothetical protein
MGLRVDDVLEGGKHQPIATRAIIPPGILKGD